jgi:hypothetical protein
MFSLAVTSRKSWESVKVVPRERLLREPDGTLVTSLQKSAVQREVLSTWTVWREVEGRTEFTAQNQKPQWADIPPHLPSCWVEGQLHGKMS